jgi:hypothetical protein
LHDFGVHIYLSSFVRLSQVVVLWF